MFLMVVYVMRNYAISFEFAQLFSFYVWAASYFSFVKQCFLLQLISSGQAEKSTSFSSSMMRIFQRGLLRQRCYIMPWTLASFLLCNRYWGFYISRLVSWCIYVYFYRDKEAPRLTESGFQFLVIRVILVVNLFIRNS